MKPEFLFTDINDHPTAHKYFDKYNLIGHILERNNSILDDEYREWSSFSLQYRNFFFRIHLIRCIKQLSFRDL